MKIANRYLAMASVILFILSFFYYLYEYNMYGKRITTGKNDYYQPRTTTAMPKKISLDEILQSVDLIKKNQCEKYKNEIKDYCLKQFYKNTYNYYDQSIDAEDMETYKISKQICCALKQVYIQCTFVYLNIICGPEEIAPIFEPLKTQMDICSRYFDSGDQCYLIANFSKDDDSTESDEDTDTD